MPASRMPATYWALRALVLGLGFTFLAAQLVNLLLPGSSHDPSPYPPFIQAIISVGAVLVALSYLAPNLWGVATPLFSVRVVLSLVAAARVLYMSALMASGVFGQKHWAIYPVIALAIVGAVSAPILLLWRRRAANTPAHPHSSPGLLPPEEAA